MSARFLSGRCANGIEADMGTLFHEVPDGSSWGTALCGVKPGRLSAYGFTTRPGIEIVTCPRCLKKLALEALGASRD